MTSEVAAQPTSGPISTPFDVVIEDEDPRLDVVQLDALVILKIIKHCKENLPELVTGQLLGLDVGRTLEVTNCFPFPNQSEDDEGGHNESGAEYQIEFMKCLREVNVDNNTVGWYQSTYLGSFLNESMIEGQYNYQATIPKAVVIIYDPVKTRQGALSLKAYRLTQAFLEVYKKQDFTQESLTKTNISFNDIFEEVPVRIHNSHLVNALLFELEEHESLRDQRSHPDFDRLELSINPFLEKNLEFLIEYIDDLSVEQNKFQYYQRSIQRQQAQQTAYLQKKKAENALRKEAGEEVEEEDISNNPLFKPIPAPSRLESLLVTNQINNYCQQINQFAGHNFSKLFLSKTINNK